MPDEPLIHPSVDGPEKSRAITAGLDALGPKPGTELKLGKCSLLCLYCRNCLCTRACIFIFSNSSINDYINSTSLFPCL